MPRPSNLPKNAQGFSLTEVMLAIFILGIVVISGIAYNAQQSKPYQRELGICRAHVGSIMEDLRRRGNAAAIRNYAPFGSASTLERVAKDPAIMNYGSPPTTRPPTKDMDGLTGAQRWPSTTVAPAKAFPVVGVHPAPARSGAPVILNSAVLIDSSVNTLLAIYNSDVANFCSAANGAVFTSTDPTKYFQPGPKDPATNRDLLKDAQTLIKIEPIDKITQAPLNPTVCPNPLLIAPTGRSSGSSSGLVSNNGAIPIQFDKVNTFNSVALKVTLRTNFTSTTGQASNCSAVSNFSYQDDGNPPSPPNVVTIMSGSNSSLTSIEQPITNYCTSLTASQASNQLVDVTLKVGDNFNGLAEPGSVFLCKDESKFLVLNAGFTYLDPVLGDFARWNAPEYGVLNQLAFFPPPPGAYFPLPQAPPYFYEERALTGQETWYPCDQVTLCGKQKETDSLFRVGTGGYSESTIRIMNLHYKIPRGCRIQMRVVSVDTAGNISPEETIGDYSYLPNMEAPFGDQKSYANFTPLSRYTGLVQPQYDCTGTPSPTTTQAATTTYTTTTQAGTTTSTINTGGGILCINCNLNHVEY